MKLILNDFVPRLGDTGDAVEVSAGYARNYLLPKKLAFEATPANVKLYENNLKQRARKISKLIQAAENHKSGIERAGELVFSRKAGDDGRLFGSVTSSDIEEALKEKGIEIDRRKITLDRQIKSLGEVEVTIKVHSKVTATIKVIVEPETEQVAGDENVEETDSGDETKAAEQVAGDENVEETDSGEETKASEEEPAPDQPDS